jgi:hypothetical protein
LLLFFFFVLLVRLGSASFLWEELELLRRVGCDITARRYFVSCTAFGFSSPLVILGRLYISLSVGAPIPLFFPQPFVFSVHPTIAPLLHFLPPLAFDPSPFSNLLWTSLPRRPQK